MSKLNVPVNNDRFKQLIAEYRTYLNSIDRAFHAVKSKFPDAVPCKPGCSACCAALFAVRPLDAALALEGLVQVNPAFAEDRLNACKMLVRDFRHRFPGTEWPFRIECTGWREFGDMVNVFPQPCPLLDNRGYCGIHPYRPRICRLAGVVFQDPNTDVILDDFCPMAEKARNSVEMFKAEFSLMGMDESVLVFQERLWQICDFQIPSGSTFLAAGILEFAGMKP
jgi:Fe-S-cluster containining protein